MGMRPIADVQYGDFLLCTMDQVVNEIAKLRYMSGGKLKVPVVMRAPVGVTGRGSQHAQSLEPYFMLLPGDQGRGARHGLRRHGTAQGRGARRRPRADLRAQAPLRLQGGPGGVRDARRLVGDPRRGLRRPDREGDRAPRGYGRDARRIPAHDALQPRGRRGRSRRRGSAAR